MESDFVQKLFPQWMTESLRSFIVTTIVLLVVGLGVIKLGSVVNEQKGKLDGLQILVDTLSQKAKDADSLRLIVNTMEVKLDSVYAWQNENIILNRINQEKHDRQLKKWDEDNVRDSYNRELQKKVLEAQVEEFKRKGLWH